MAEEKKEKIPTWGYSKNDSKIFHLSKGESLPNGYFAHPAMVQGSKAAREFAEHAEREKAPNQFAPQETRPTK